MGRGESHFLDKVLGRLDRLDAGGVQAVVRRLVRERRFFEQLFATIEDGVLVVDPRGKILYSNPSVRLLLGWPDEPVEGRAVRRLMPDLDWNVLLALRNSDGQQVVRRELEVTYPRHRFLRMVAAPLDGDVKGLVVVLHDATEARQETYEVVEAERVQALTQLAASVAHEIGNPLNALHIHLQLMERELARMSDLEARTNRLRRFLDVAKGEVARLDTIVTQFLGAIRPSAPRRRRASLNQVVRETLGLLGPELENRGLEVVERLCADLPDASLDPAQIQQVLVNLVKNAMQAMRRSGTLTLETGFDDEEVWVGVRDTGCGIGPEHMRLLFQPFFTTKDKGNGLGLMIVQRIVREHGGRIELESHEGQGTQFRIRLPRRERGMRLLEASNP